MLGILSRCYVTNRYDYLIGYNFITGIYHDVIGQSDLNISLSWCFDIRQGMCNISYCTIDVLMSKTLEEDGACKNVTFF